VIAFIVPLGGITQVITYRKLSTNSPERLKQIGLKILQSFGLTKTVPAAGVMFVSRKGGVLSIKPVVWVRDIRTLFHETACASGTTAVAIVEALKQKRNLNSLPILQPSGSPLLAAVRLSKGRVSFAEIGGPVKIII
jgi:diaminopimelate epimerase